MRTTAFLIALAALAGCNRTKVDYAPTKAPNENLTAQQRVVAATPVLRRSVTANDLNQLKIFMEQARTETGKYPRSLADLPGLQRDAPNIHKLIQDGDLVLAGDVNGVLAYEKAALEVRGSVLTTEGVQALEPAELKRKLGR
jgi:hypothetical protein